MIALAFWGLLLINGIIALASRSKGLRLIAALLAISFGICSLISGAKLQPDNWLHGLTTMPGRVAVFSVLDLAVLLLCVAIIQHYKIMKALRYAFGFTFLSMLAAHVILLVIGDFSHPIVYTYKSMLNSFFVMQIIICAGAGCGDLLLAVHGNKLFMPRRSRVARS